MRCSAGRPVASGPTCSTAASRGIRCAPEFGAHFVTFQAARTRYFDNYFRAAADAGVRQIVLLAAGLDSRPTDWTGLPGPRCSVDQPQVLEFKRRPWTAALRGAQRREVAVDLRDDWQAALRASGFRGDEPSAWIAEGLLIYLPGEAQERLFAGIDAMACSGSRVAVEEPAHGQRVVQGQGRGRPGHRRHARAILAAGVQRAMRSCGAMVLAAGWTSEATTLTDYMRSVNRLEPMADPEVVNMITSITLVSAVKG